MRARGARQPGMQAGERAREPADGIRDDRHAERGVAVEILVGVDQHVADLRREAPKHMRDHWLACEFDPSFVDAAHASALAAGEHDARDVSGRDHDVGGALSSGSHAACSL